MSQQFGPIDPEERAQYSGAAPSGRRRKLAATVLAIGVMALFAGALWFAYEAGRGHTAGPGGVPLIRADATPAKVKPAAPDGMHVPDQNMLIYNEKEPKVERLLPPPEQPMPRPAPPPPATPAAATPAAAPAMPAPAQPTVSAAATPPPAPAAPPLRAPAALPAAPSKPSSGPLRTAAVPPKAAAAETAKRAGEGVHVQLGALRSPELAEREWARLKRAHADILGRLSASPVRADLGSKGIFYRIEVGPLPTPQAAARLCGELKERNVGCMLVR